MRISFCEPQAPGTSIALLTQADVVCRYMDQTVQEQGTHDELISKEGEYARMWNLQANAFI
jgi:ABC-type multidrug transport system fused ATPase/permease subunit